ncbi:hypothetical protein Tco_1382016 [Tanacetum coccineum]
MAFESSSQQQQKQLSPTLNLNFELKDGIIAFGIAFENYVSLPPKETTRSALATLRLVNEKDTSLSSTDLVNSSPLRTRYFSSIWSVLMVYIVKCMGEEAYKSLFLPSGEVNTDDFADKSLSRTNVQPVTQSKATTNKKSRKKKNPASSKLRTLKTIRESSLSPQVTYTQPAKDPEAIVDATYSIDASELT